MSSRPPSESGLLTLYEKQTELKRILESKYFAKAPKKRQFLEFTSGQVFVGAEDKLNEYLIGVEVYERGQDFDPQQDPIVRVQAHEIRRALKAYYSAEGKDSLLRVELNPGHYAPIFKRFQVSSEDAANAVSPAPAVVVEAPQRRPPWEKLVIAALAVLCALFGMLFVRDSYLLRQRGPAVAISPLPDTVEWFWKPFLAPESRPLVVVPTSPLLRLGTEADTADTLRRGNLINKAKLPEFNSTIQFRELKDFVFLPTMTDYTGIGETLGLLNFSRFLAGRGIDVRVMTGRLVNYSEIENGNTIILGGGNEWTNRVFANRPGFVESHGAFKDNFPGPSESPIFAPKFDPITNRLTQDYAVVFMGPNHSQQERLLLLFGLYTQGTEAAAEYVTNPQSLAELRRALLASAPDKKTLPPFFEALISVPVENYVPGSASLVAVRPIAE